MPNWCHNYLTITGDKQELDKFIKFTDKKLDFNKFVPYPEKFKRKDEAHPKRQLRIYQSGISKIKEETQFPGPGICI